MGFLGGTQVTRLGSRHGSRRRPPQDSELDFYSMKVVGNDLWAASGYGNDGHVMRLSGNNSNWTVWDVDTNDIPDGYGADIVLCQDIVHIAVGFSAWQWWAVGGG